MELEVLSKQTGSVAWRGWAATALLFLLASVPAWWLSQSRAGELKRTRVHPLGWSISFYPPNRFDAGVQVTNREVRVFAFRRPMDVGYAEIRVERFHDADPVRGALDLCERVLRPHNSLFVAMLAPKPAPIAKRLGGWDGIEVDYRAIDMVVRAAVTEGAEGYAVSLRVENESITDELFRTFEAVCESVQAERGRGGNVMIPGGAGELNSFDGS